MVTDNEAGAVRLCKMCTVWCVVCDDGIYVFVVVDTERLSRKHVVGQAPRLIKLPKNTGKLLLLHS